MANEVKLSSAEHTATPPIHQWGQKTAQEVSDVDPCKPAAAIAAMDAQHLRPTTIIGADGFGVLMQAKVGPGVPRVICDF